MAVFLHWSPATREIHIEQRHAFAPRISAHDPMLSDGGENQPITKAHRLHKKQSLELTFLVR